MLVTTKGRKRKERVPVGQLSLFDLFMDSTETIVSEVTTVVEQIGTVLQEVKAIEEEMEQFQEEQTVEVLEVTPTNYQFASIHQLYESGVKAKFKNNVSAIQLVKRLICENRYPTAQEQLVLAKYTGWGGLADALTEGKKGWEKEYAQIQDLLTPQEFKSAQESTVSAFYTEPYIIQAMYQALEQFGFKGGNLLEPACGTGNFFSVLPDSMASSALYGVELDTISGAIASKLYPTASIQVKGFEETTFPDQFFDVAIGNIPFNHLKVHDQRYNKYNFLIHDYFIAKTLDLVRPGGLIAFITSKGTLDKQNKKIREYIAQRASLIGAIRLPNNAFKTIGGTEVTADILFLQKHESLVDLTSMPSWVSVDEVEGMPLNRYFVEHPEMVLGQMAYDQRMYGSESTTCVPIEGMNLEKELSRCVQRLHAVYEEVAPISDEETVERTHSSAIAALQTVRNYSYTLQGDQIYYRENSKMYLQEVPGRRGERLKGMIQLLDLVREIIACQSESFIEEQTEDAFQSHFKALLAQLNTTYDAFVQAFGYLNSKTNTSLFSLDAGAPLLQSIEVEHKEQKDVYEKGAFFFKQTVHPFQTPTQAETPEEALNLSLNLKGMVDLKFMCELYSTFKGEPVTIEELVHELGARIYLNPEKVIGAEDETLCWETADAYLSGFVKDKLRVAKEAALRDARFNRNVEALEAAQPIPLQADEISFILGSTWIPTEYYNDFLHQLFDVAWVFREDHIYVEYSEVSNVYRVHGKAILDHTVLASQTFGTTRMNGFKIFEETLNLKSVEVKDKVFVYNSEGERVERYVINQQETLLAREKQALIKMEFENWLFEDKDRAEAITALYNDKFNDIRPRQFDGSDLLFPGMTPDIKLETHQRNVIAHGLYGEGNLLIAQEVGAGKTYSAIAIGHEMKRLGLINKPLYVIPNHLVGQWAREYLTLYPSANILVASKKDLEKKRRRQFVSRMATGDYDAILIAQSSFELIGMSPAYQKRVIEADIAEIESAITQLSEESEGRSFSLKQAVLMKKKLEAQYLKLVNESKKDDVIYFEELGVDCLIVDEAHAYKNNFTYTKLQNVAGIGNTRSQRAMDMFMKVQYINEKNHGRGVIYLTGTPVSNSMSELHVLQKTLQPQALKERGLLAFDCWASMFGRIESSLEIKPEGNGYQLKQRFARFHNLPELMNLFSLIADIKTADMLNLPTPDLKDGKPTVIKTEVTDAQREIIYEHGERAEMIRGGQVDSTVDNFLKLTLEARLNAIDPRILNPSIPYNANTKLNVCAAKVAEIYHETAENRLTQIIFCDQGTPKSGEFNFYDATKEELVRLGVQAEEIVFIHEAKTDAQRLELFEKVIKGEVRVLMGSTSKMGTGVNVQNKLIALHHLDIPWRPADLTQRNGRILRRGNENEEVMIFNYITEDTFDGYLWQILEQKQRYISQIMTGRSQLRTCEDLDDTTLQYAEFKALAVADPRIKRKMEVDNELNRLTLLKSMWKREQARLNENIQTKLPEKITGLVRTIEVLEKDVSTYQSYEAAGQFEVEINGMIYHDRDEANQAMRLYLANISTHLTQETYRKMGSYLGFEFGLTRKSFLTSTELYLKGDGIHRTRFVSSRVLAQLDAVGKGLASKLEESRFKLSESHKELETAKEQVTQTFVYDEQLKLIQAEKVKLDLELEFEQVR